jgi:ABC-2 type transport system ATP-binding protein
MDQKLKNYSSGMQVRLAFSLATRASGDVLLVDEVLAVGDAAFQRKCFEYFRTLKRNDTTVVFVTHNMEAVREFCDRAIMIEDSRLVADGTGRDVAEQYTRLFTPTAADGEASAPNPDNRWGGGQVRYVDVDVPAVLDGDEELVVQLEAEASEAVDEVVFGFAVLSSGGNAVLGADSLRKQHGCVSLRAGERRRIRWSVPNIFSDGRYTLDVAIVDRSGVTTYDHWKESATFTVVKDEKTAYPVTPRTSFEIVDEVDSDVGSGSRD